MHPPTAPLGARRQNGPGRVTTGRSRSLGGVHVGLLLCLGDVFLVADALIAEPVVNLKVNC